MSAQVDNLKLNKKGTRVKIIGMPRWFNIFGTAIQWSPTFTYLAIKFDLFTFKNQGYAITGWGVVFIAGLFIAFRQKIKDKFKEYEESFGPSWNRAKGGHISLGIATVLLGVSIFSTSLFIVFFIFSGSTYLSLLLYGPYDELNKKRVAMQKMLDSQNQKADFETLSAQFNQL